MVLEAPVAKLNVSTSPIEENNGTTLIRT